MYAKSLIVRMSSLEYPSELIKMMTKGTRGSVPAASVIGFLLFSVALMPFIPITLLIGWFLLQLLFLALRVVTADKLDSALDENRRDVKRWLKYNLTLTVMGSILWGLTSWISALYAPEAYTYFVLAILLTLTSGATSTIGAVFHAYAAFTIPILLLISTSYLYIGGEVNYLISVVTIMAMIILISNGYNYYLRLKKMVALSSQLKNFNEALEKRVQKEVNKNIEKDIQLMHQARLAQMGEMVSMIAHQWRQPLHIISSAATDLDLKIQFGTIDDETCLKNIDTINNLTQHLSSTIDDFRDFFKVTKEMEVTTIDEIVSVTLKIVKEYVENKNIIINTDLNCSDKFDSYPNELKQVLLNLLKNAEDVLLERGIENARIMIKSYRENGMHCLEVCDNAGGIEAEVKEHIFDAYFTTKEEGQGTGLGLYMSKRIINEHCGGTLSVENSIEGACFKIMLPR
jgi:signal transduction histidine kinase